MTPEQKLALKQMLQINPRYLTNKGRRKRAEVVADCVKTKEGFIYYWDVINGKL